MWISVLVSAITFALSHIPEIVAVLKAIFDFFKQHAHNPNLSRWLKDFAGAMSTSKTERSPGPLLEFLAKLRAELEVKA